MLLLQLWYIVPPSQHQAFILRLQQLMGLNSLATAGGLTAVKTLLPLLPAEAVRELGVRRLVQRPGDIILTSPVSTEMVELGRKQVQHCNGGGASC